MNWGWKIAFLYIGFVVMMLALVFATTTTRFHLVTDEYYQKEQLVDDHFVRVKNAQQLEVPISITYLAETEEIKLAFPEYMENIQGDVLCYRPSNSDWDREFTLSTGEENIAQLDASNLQHGVWRIQINWEGDNQPFYSEKVLVIPK